MSFRTRSRPWWWACWMTSGRTALPSLRSRRLKCACRRSRRAVHVLWADRHIAWILPCARNAIRRRVIPELRDVMRRASPELANSTFTTMEQVVEDSYGSQQLAARLLEIFGGTALVLCIAGIYGLLAYLVTQRTRELGIRIALGAQRSAPDGDGDATGGGMLMAGLAVGLLLAYATSRVVAHASLWSEAARSVDHGCGDSDSVGGRAGRRIHPGASGSSRGSDGGSSQRVSPSVSKRVTRRAA